MKEVFVCDTSSLVHSPNSLHSFGDSLIVIPMAAFEEIDSIKHHRNDAASANARHIIRTIDKLQEEQGSSAIELDNGAKVILDDVDEYVLSSSYDSSKADNQILNVAACYSRNKEFNVTVVSNDASMRAKARKLGLRAITLEEDRINIRVDDIYPGWSEYQVAPERVDKLYKEGVLKTRKEFLPNEFVLVQDQVNPKHGGLGKYNKNSKEIEKLKFYGAAPWDISGRNLQQHFALELLMDPTIQIVSIIGKAGTGKAQPLYSNILTPTGWVKMGEIKTGDKVVTPSGEESTVIGIFPQGVKDIFRVHFTDGSYTDCCDDHLWNVRTSVDRNNNKTEYRTMTLSDIRTSLRYGRDNKRNYSIPMVNEINFSSCELPINPYLLGCLIGDGGLSTSTPHLTTTDDEIIDSISHMLPEGVEIYQKPNDPITYSLRTDRGQSNPLGEALRDLGLMPSRSEDKFIPSEYIYGSSFADRVALLQGLMDTDGTVDNGGKHTSFATSSKRLANDMVTLVQSLGGVATVTIKNPRYTHKGETKNGLESYVVTVSVSSHIAPFRLSRKIEKYIPKTKYKPTRYIDRVEYIGKEEAQCILIDHSDHLYVTDNFIVTHNTLLALAAGGEQVDKGTYDKMVVYKPLIPVGRDVGFLPGELEDKIGPYMGSIYDNLEFMLGKPTDPKDDSNDKIDYYIRSGKLELAALTFIRGRSLPKLYILVDEAQNLTPHEVKTIATRLGEGAKVVFVGDPYQIDHPFLDYQSNGLTYLTERLKGQSQFGTVTLKKPERSTIAEMCAELL